ncbi:MAG: hypothetical protein K9L86_01320 [Candidatus Omnitrophica bacterium]|nr:hypothetical protein [Candidatus Omnitrophota bacterium]
MAGKGLLPLPWLVECLLLQPKFILMYGKKGFASLISIVVTFTIISALILLIMNKLYLRKDFFNKNDEANPSAENIGSSEYQTLLKRSENTAESLNKKFQDQQKVLNRW